MIPRFAARPVGALAGLFAAACSGASDAPVATNPAAAPKASSSCLESGDGYLRATVAGEIEARLDWPNSGTQCEGESRDSPPGIRLSFHRDRGAPNLLLVFGLNGVREGEAAHEVGANLTVIAQGSNHIYGTLGDSRCTIDELTQRPLGVHGTYRVEARGFCTQPAHAVRGKGDVLVSTFEFAGRVTFSAPEPVDPDPKQGASL